jgi:DNA polymerase-4
VQRRRGRRAFGAQSALGRRRRSRAEVDSVLVGLVDRVTRRMRAAGRIGRTVMLRLRFDDFSRATRSHTLGEATTQNRTILAAARGLLAAATPEVERRGLTLIGLSLTNLEDADAIQLALPLERRPVNRLDATIDDVRERFGTTAITRAVLLGRDPGIAMPHLPD